MTYGQTICAQCGGGVDVHHAETLFEIIGWERKRSQGGQNHVIDRQQTGRLLCVGCAKRLRLGLNSAQESLL